MRFGLCMPCVCWSWQPLIVLLICGQRFLADEDKLSLTFLFLSPLSPFALWYLYFSLALSWYPCSSLTSSPLLSFSLICPFLICPSSSCIFSVCFCTVIHSSSVLSWFITSCDLRRHLLVLFSLHRCWHLLVVFWPLFFYIIFVLHMVCPLSLHHAVFFFLSYFFALLTYFSSVFPFLLFAFPLHSSTHTSLSTVFFSWTCHNFPLLSAFIIRSFSWIYFHVVTSPHPLLHLFISLSFCLHLHSFICFLSLPPPPPVFFPVASWCRMECSILVM